jgi:gas vesicle protein
MALPVVPFIIGAAAGSVATYLYRDKDARKQWLEAAEDWYAGLASLWRSDKPAEQASEVAGQVVDTTAEFVDAARDAVEEAVEEQGTPEVHAPKTDPNSTSVH